MASDAVMPSLVAVAFSGGRDSTALLHATACAAREQVGLDVVALHVHHGLSVHADAWLAHAQKLCDDWARQDLPVRLISRRVQLELKAGDSIEASARHARYAALTDMAREAGADVILLAHHRRDQAETFLLQALRGAGVSGLASMPADVHRDGLRWVRPWLAHPREAIEAYVAHHGLHYIEDDSNANTRFARNHLRLDVWSTLLQAFPSAEASLASSASRLADVLPGVEAWRAQLLSRVSSRAETASGTGTLDAAVWADLSGSERRESLGYWYRCQTGRALPASWAERLAHEVPGLVYRQQPAHWAPVGVGLYRGLLSVDMALPRTSALQGAPAHANASANINGSENADTSVCIVAPGELTVPEWGGTIRVSCVDREGVTPAVLKQAIFRPRRGGEQFQSGPARPARSLKKQFQSAGVPAWCRHGPLIFSGEKLVFVSGLGVDARSWALPGEPQWALEWVPFAR